MPKKIIIHNCKECPCYEFVDKADYCNQRKNWIDITEPGKSVENSIDENCVLDDA